MRFKFQELLIDLLPKWSKDAKEFTVNVQYDDEKGSQARIPKPILERLGKPEKITFVVEGRKVEVKRA